jgi:NADH-quinone oxidoreductase subunit A
MKDYGYILIFMFIICVLAIALFFLSYLSVTKNYDLEKISPYECGFEPFSDTRSMFEVRYYLVAILFIIFDLEVVFLFPFAVVLGYLDIFSFLTVMLFLLLLTVGFLYEWMKGALEWE